MNEAKVRAEDLDEATRAALQRLILTLADTKRLMGLRYSDWVLGAPSIETGIAASSMSQDEWGHARLLYAMLKDFGVTPATVEHERPAAAYASVDPLDRAFPDWAAVVAGMVVVDGAATTALEAFSRGRFAPASSRNSTPAWAPPGTGAWPAPRRRWGGSAPQRNPCCRPRWRGWARRMRRPPHWRTQA